MLVSGLVLGLLGSLHCVGMCGPIAFMLPVDRSNSFKKVSQIGIYHFNEDSWSNIRLNLRLGVRQGPSYKFKPS